MIDRIALTELRARRRASGEWDVIGPSGEQLATGFDTEAEANEWIGEQGLSGDGHSNAN